MHHERAGLFLIIVFTSLKRPHLLWMNLGFNVDSCFCRYRYCCCCFRRDDDGDTCCYLTSSPSLTTDDYSYLVLHECCSPHSATMILYWSHGATHTLHLCTHDGHLEYCHCCAYCCVLLTDSMTTNPCPNHTSDAPLGLIQADSYSPSTNHVSDAMNSLHYHAHTPHHGNYCLRRP